MCIKLIKSAFISLALKIAMRRPAPNRFPTSPPRALQNNFYEINLVEDQPGVYVLVRGLKPKEVSGYRFDTTTGDRTEVNIPKNNLGDYRFQSIHYLKGYTLTTHSALLFIVGAIIWFPRVLIWIDKGFQAIFNRRNLERQDRLNVLRIFLARTVEKDDFAISEIALVQIIHSNRGLHHPRRYELLRYYRLLMESFVSDGYLSEAKGLFKLLPAGFSGLAELELEEQRYQGNRRQQSLMGLFTFVLVCIGLIQAYAAYMAMPVPGP
ncbi:hypothetical protein [Mesorhizobium sp. ORM16]|uniref:hypothetical protein n=1 Tax=Mesorhizobium sp. ORM16 TaxID=3376989 RepID=UPI0038579943